MLLSVRLLVEMLLLVVMLLWLHVMQAVQLFMYESTLQVNEMLLPTKLATFLAELILT